MGIFNILYTNPYQVASFTRYYAELRAEAIEKGIPGSELLYDTYLYEKAESYVIAAKYPDVIKVLPTQGKKAQTQNTATYVLSSSFWTM